MPSLDLAAMVKEQNSRKRVLRLRPIVTTTAQEGQLYRVYLKLMRIWEAAAKELIERYPGQMTQDAAFQDRPDWVSVILSFTQRRAGKYVEAAATKLFEAWGDKVARWHMQRLLANLKYGADVEASQSLISPQAETVGEAVQYNVDLIKDLSSQMRTKLEQAVLEATQQRRPATQLAKEIREITGMGRSRARRIASDQTVKLGAALDRDRDQQLGFEEFIWRHSGKRHPRIEHLERDGKKFRYDDPALVGDLPGDLIHCGCKAEPYMEL